MLGFNKSEVNVYLLKLQQDFNKKEQQLKKTISELQLENASLKKRCAAAEYDINKKQDEINNTNGKIQQLNDEFAYLKAKEEQIEQMSESIGTMYMLAMQNAEQIVSEAEECARDINQISALRLEAASKAEEQLKAIKANIKSSAEQFAEDINSMSLSLEGPKKRLEEQLSKEEEKTALPETAVE